MNDIRKQTDTKAIGNSGEDLAADYLSHKGYRILARNYRSGKLETDIIATADGVIAFIEVKTRSKMPGDTFFGTPASAVNREKQKKLVQCARAYLRTHPKGDCLLRMDVIEIYLNPRDGTLAEIQHFENAFGAN